MQTMRLKKGTKVEVLTQKEVSSGSWRCAEIIGIDGRSYIVRYDGDIELIGQAKVERVSRKEIRPRPPIVDGLQNWVPGDVVEVFHKFAWNMATILMVSGCNQLLVRLLGSATEIRTNSYDVRPRLCWQDGEWIVIRKASNKSEDLGFRFPSSRNIKKSNTFADRDLNGVHASTQNSYIFQDSPAKPSTTLKTKLSHCCSQVEAHAGPHKRIRVGEQKSKWNQFNAVRIPQLPEKVENVASSRELLRGKCMHRTLNNKINGCYEMIMEREKTYGAVGFSRSIRLESHDDHSVLSSVASCSANRNSHLLHHVFTTAQFEGNDGECSDAESCCHLGSEEVNTFSANKDLREYIHRLEVHAYRCTIGALYASGPLSWDQELLLTNLRDSLHISNDEHLMEIKNLV